MHETDMIKTREDLFNQIATKLFNEGLINENDYSEHNDAICDVAKCIELALEPYTILKGICNLLEPELRKVSKGVITRD